MPPTPSAHHLLTAPQPWADHVASRLPTGTPLVKAFNTIGAEHLSDGIVDGARAFLPLAGDSSAAETVADLAEQLGFDAVVLGDRSTFAMVEDFARLWIHLAFAKQWGRQFAFTAVGDPNR